MKNCGIIVEYNPFHNGHKFHIESAKKQADGIIAVMSGSFVQRGEPALLNKFIRAKTAIAGGADLVIELPFCFSCAPAQFFAEGGIRLLAATGMVDSLCFGSECGNIELLKNAGNTDNNIKEYLDKGMSYPAACAAASESPLSAPNDILGAEYLRAISLYAPHLVPITVKRTDGGYHSETGENGFASATAIRKSGIKNSQEFIPAEVFGVLEKAASDDNYTDISLLDSLILGKLRSGCDMRPTAYVSEGIENRFYDASFSATSLKDLISNVKTKRYTYARLMRIAACYAVGLTDEDLSEFVNAGPQYIRILAASENGKKMLSMMKKKSSLPIITTPSSYKKLSPLAQKMFELDCMATDIAALATKNPALREGRQDFKKLNIF